MVIKKLKTIYSQIRDGEPGRRFRDLHEKWHSKVRKSAWQKFGYPIIGTLLIVAGALLSIPPGVPGFVVVLIGLGILAARSHLVAVLLDHGESKLRQLIGSKS
jgi:hypothetical protein